MVVPQHRDQI